MDIVLWAFTDKWWDWDREGFSSRTAALACGLAEHPRIDRLLVVDTPRSLAAKKRDYEHEPAVYRHGQAVVRRPEQGVYVLDHLRALPRERHHEATAAVNSLLHDSSLIRSVRRTCAFLGMRDTVSIHAGPLTAQHAGSLNERLCIYDAVDEWLAHPAFRGMQRSIAAGYTRFVDRADLVLAVSPALAEVFSAAREVRVLPNAVGRDWVARETQVPADLAALGRPVVGYTGALQQRFDVDLLAGVARRMPHASFCLVGPVQCTAHFEPLNSLDNVHFLGPKDHRLLRTYVDGFDACIMPHVSTRLTQCMDPIKLYEYVAAGKPTIATGVGAIERFGGAVRSVTGVTGFLAALQEVFSGGWRVDASFARDFARDNSWTARINEVVGLLSDRMAEKASESRREDGVIAVERGATA